jgi:uncharacterized protein YfaS (alpha-2-macroglobulin family)
MKRLIAVTVLMAMVLGCGGKGTDHGSAQGLGEGPIDLHKEVVKTPDAVVSVIAPLEVTFRNPLIPDYLVGSTLDNTPFTFKPAVVGTSIWVSTTTLQFTPQKAMAPGVDYKAVLKGKALFGSKRKVNDLAFSFKTAEQEVVSFVGDFVAEGSAPNMVRFEATMGFAQAVALNRLKKDLVVTLDKRKLSLQLALSNDGMSLRVSTQAVKRDKQAHRMLFILPGKYTVGSSKWENEVILPEANVFKVLAHMDMSRPGDNKSTYGFRFSDPIKSGMDHSAYVSIEPRMTYELSVDGKYLKIIGDFNYGQEYTIKIRQGFPSALGTRLSSDYYSGFTFSNIKPEVKWLSSGVYLPSTNKSKLQFKSVNVRRVAMRITEIFPNNVGFFLQNNSISEPQNSEGSEYDEYYGGSSFTDLERVGKTIVDTQLIVSTMKNKWVVSELALEKLIKKKQNSVFVVQLSFGQNDLYGNCTNDINEIGNNVLYYPQSDYYSNPCESGYYYRRGNKEKLLIASDIALTVKQSESGLHVFATNIVKARPAQGIALGNYSYQNQLLEKKTTNGDGYCFFSKKGHYLRGVGGNATVMYRIGQGEWELSSFEISGSEAATNGLDIFSYTDRGVHRPGDTVHMAIIVRSDHKAPPADQPLSIKLYSPLDNVMFEGAQKCGKNGHLYFALPTASNDPTGSWRAEISTGGQIVNHTLKIETIKPNRLKINFDIPDTLTGSPVMLRGELCSKFLFGTPAAGLTARLKVDIASIPISFSTYKDFTFTNPVAKFSHRNEEIFEAPLDENGCKSFAAPLSDATQYSTMFKATLQAQVYEKGGSFTSGAKAVTISPYGGYVGVKNEFSWNGARTGEQHGVPIIVTDKNGRPLKGRQLKVEVYLNRDYWWWEYGTQSDKDFRTLKTTYKLSESTVISDAKPVIKKLTVEDQGQHLILVTDELSGHTSGFFFWASEYGHVSDAEKKDRIFLTIATDKNVYYTGDKAQLSVETPGQGTLIFTLEQGKRIVHQEIKAASQGRTTFNFTVGEELLPNCYAVVSLIQPHQGRKNDTPLRIYGVKPIAVEDPSTRLPLKVDVPKEIKPQEKFSMTVRSGSKKDATVTVAIVDEGLLDLTGFVPPDAWAHYFRKLRLGVTTGDNCEDILGVLFPDVDQRYSIGGDAELESRKRNGDSKNQRFKPVVLYKEPFTLGAGKSKKLEFSMPNYVGSVSIVVIGSAGNSYATVEKIVPVRQPLMILTTVPRVARPGDAFELPVSVFSMVGGANNVAVKMNLSNNLQVMGESEQSVYFDRAGEKDVSFFVKVGNSIGDATIEVDAQGNGFAASDKISLPITAPNPFYIEAVDSQLPARGAITVVPTPFGIKGTNRARLAISRFPDIQIDKRYKDLIHYPYGCLEQTVSAAFPQLFIPSLLDVNAQEKAMMTANINAAIERLQQFRLSDGFSMWPASGNSAPQKTDWGTSYAAHFLIEAKKMGYHVPEDLHTHFQNSIKLMAKEVNNRDFRNQCYSLFLLALSGNSNQSAMNMVRENYLGALDPLSRKLLAASYHLAGNQSGAKHINADSPTEISDYREMSGTFGSPIRDRSLIALLSYKMGDMATAARLMRSIAKDFHPQSWYSTHETAMALLAVTTIYGSSSNVGGAVPYRLDIEGMGGEKKLLKRYQEVIDISSSWNRNITIENQSDNPLFVTLFTEGIPLENRITTQAQGLELTRNFYDDDGSPLSISDIRQGNPFWIRYRVRSATSESLKSLALSSMLPSGWEIINLRLEGIQRPLWIEQLGVSDGDYMDIRDDRVNWFFNLSSSTEMNFVVKVNPSFRGTYRLPPVTVEAMYSPDYYAHIEGGTVAVR